MQLIVKDWIYKNPCVQNVTKGNGEDKIETQQPRIQLEAPRGQPLNQKTKKKFKYLIYLFMLSFLYKLY